MTQKFTHKDYVLTQTDYNHHFMIFASDGHMVMHVPYNKTLTEEKARGVYRALHFSFRNIG